MASIKLIDNDEATGRVAEIYQQMNDSMGFVPNAFRIFSSSEHILDIQNQNLIYFIRHKSLGGKLLAFIRYLVSEVEKCEYCIGMNAGILLQYGVLPEALQGYKLNPATAPLEPNEIQLLLFVLKVVHDSTSVKHEEVEALRAIGWTDKDILDATYHATTQMSVDKILNAFGLEAEH